MIPRRPTYPRTLSACAGVLLALAATVQPGLAETAGTPYEPAPLVHQVAPPRPAPAQIPGGAGVPVTSSTGTQVTGTVTYRERIALPPNAVIHVSLQDVSRAGAPAIILGEQSIPANGAQVPIPFAIAYDPAAIDERFTYSVRARITVDGQLAFTSTTATLVITRGNPTQVEIVVERP